MTAHDTRWAWAEVDLGAVAHNIDVLRTAAAPSAVWAVVKADGYGHGAVPVARTALDAGAEGLCVALASEGVELRAAGIGAPILLLSEQPPELAPTIVAHDLTATVSTTEGIDAIATAVRESGRLGVGVHLKVDTGMHRVGAQPEHACVMGDRIAELAPALRLAGVFTHLAVADDIANPYTTRQLARFDEAIAALDLPADAVRHAANSAGGLAHPGARYSLVRAGIAVYGISPFDPGKDPDGLAAALRPVMSLRARVSFVKRLRAGDGISYGLRHTFARDTTVATVPIGYADGVRRTLSGTGTCVLVGGVRREIVGAITMDQLMVDCGDDPVVVGDEVVLIGRQGDDEIRAEDWSATLGTIGYEIVCGISARVPRRYVNESAPVATA
jgi:alanine racemase